MSAFLAKPWLGLVVALAATTSAQAQPQTAQVAIIEPAFQPPSAWTYDPAELTVKVGTTVTWTNQGAVLHTVTVTADAVTATGIQFDSGDLRHGESFSFTFETVGTFAYYCRYHLWMTGTVVVVP
ncbi:MAG: plastocyanin/azurin family copper-binding protein [Geminicoccaceae bacterium]